MLVHLYFADLSGCLKQLLERWIAHLTDELESNYMHGLYFWNKKSNDLIEKLKITKARNNVSIFDSAT